MEASETPIEDTKTDTVPHGHSLDAQSAGHENGDAFMPTNGVGEDEASRLKDLATDVRDQDDLERDINRQADQLLNAQAIERDQKRLDKTKSEKE